MTTTLPAQDDGTRTGYAVCSICDIGCQLRSESRDGRLERSEAFMDAEISRSVYRNGVNNYDVLAVIVPEGLDGKALLQLTLEAVHASGLPARVCLRGGPDPAAALVQ